MRAVILQPPGGAGDNMLVADVPKPQIKPGEALVAVNFAGCNFADLMMRAGTYPHPKGYPLIAGLEIAGQVAAVGTGVTQLSVGDRVAGFSEDAGGFAQFCAIPANRLVRIPDDVGLDVAAAFFLQALTAWYLIHGISAVSRGERVLIHAIGGGVGLYLTQLAAKADANVIGTVGTKGKEQRALDFGAAKVVNRDDDDFEAAIMDYTIGEGVDKIIDSTGGSILDRSFNLIRLFGHVISYGESEARPYDNLWEQLVRKSLTFTRFHFGHINCHSQVWTQGAATIMDRVSSGALKVPIEGVYTLENIHDMYARLESRTVSGKLILNPAP